MRDVELMTSFGLAKIYRFWLHNTISWHGLDLEAGLSTLLFTSGAATHDALFSILNAVWHESLIIAQHFSKEKKRIVISCT